MNMIFTPDLTCYSLGSMMPKKPRREFRLPTADFPLQTSHFVLPTSNSRSPTSYSEWGELKCDRPNMTFAGCWMYLVDLLILMWREVIKFTERRISCHSEPFGLVFLCHSVCELCGIYLGLTAQIHWKISESTSKIGYWRS